VTNSRLSLIVRLRVHQLVGNLPVMTENQRCIVQSLESANHVETAIPCIVISR
jgi:hypothetical protein